MVPSLQGVARARMARRTKAKVLSRGRTRCTAAYEETKNHWSSVGRTLMRMSDGGADGASHIVLQLSNIDIPCSSVYGPAFGQHNREPFEIQTQCHM